MITLELSEDEAQTLINALAAVTPSGGGGKLNSLGMILNEMTGLDPDLWETVGMMETAAKELAEAKTEAKLTMIEELQLRICWTDWDWVPAPLWALAISPLLYWAGIKGPHIFNWPAGRSKNPLRRSFWNGRGRG